MGDADADNEIERQLDAFRGALDERWVLCGDRSNSEEVSREARPVAIALLATQGEDGDSHFEHREALALTSLLGRRIGGLGISPTAMLSVVPALLDALALPEALRAALEPVFVEGFVAAREERLAERHALHLGEGIVGLTLLPRLWCVFIGGAQEASVLEPVFDGLGRRLLEHDAAALLVHVGRLDAPTPEAAAQVFTLDATCRMLGVRCIFSEVGDGLREAAMERDLDLSLVEILDDPAAAFQCALDACGLTVRETRGLGKALRRFVGGR